MSSWRPQKSEARKGSSMTTKRATNVNWESLPLATTSVIYYQKSKLKKMPTDKPPFISSYQPCCCPSCRSATKEPTPKCYSIGRISWTSFFGQNRHDRLTSLFPSQCYNCTVTFKVGQKSISWVNCVVFWTQLTCVSLKFDSWPCRWFWTHEVRSKLVNFNSLKLFTSLSQCKYCNTEVHDKQVLSLRTFKL